MMPHRFCAAFPLSKVTRDTLHLLLPDKDVKNPMVTFFDDLGAGHQFSRVRLSVTYNVR